MNAEKIDDYDEKLDITSPNYVYTEEDWKHINEALDDIKEGRTMTLDECFNSFWEERKKNGIQNNNS
jgi:tetrahydromethanopterin S-methyltransferase subunit G